MNISLETIEKKIALVAENLRDLSERSAALSGAANEDRLSDQMEDQQAIYDELLRQRDEISGFSK